MDAVARLAALVGARQMEYVTAARAAGAGNLRIILRHIAPNILGPIIVIASLDVAWIILGIAGLSFLGLGAQPPTPEWGAMLNDARLHLQTAPRLLLLPGAAIFVAVLGFNLLGDGMRDMLDPRTASSRG
ncbi:MAG: ABC transporter permease [Chloroflexota bacterium]|nr:ABC transporter permease [Chloroflexota bacterium]MDE2959735.1 ABC transporter permease [Chloroflexota bacterium]